MDFMKPRTWTVAEIGCLKWAAILIGAVIGAYIPELVKQYVWLFVLSAAILSIKPVSGYFRQNRDE